MRVTDYIRAQNLLYNLRLRDENMTEAQLQIATGKRINQPSDDPNGADKALSFRRQIAQNEQYQRNIEDGLNYMTFADAKLDAINTILTDARSIAVTGDNDNMTAEDRQVLANEINQLLEELVNNSQASFSGKMIFAGQNYNTQPFTVERNLDDLITSVTPNPDGIDGQIERQIGLNIRESINIGGGELFQPDGAGTETDMFSLLINLRDALNTNDTASIGSQIDLLDDSIEHLSYQRAGLGEKVNYFNRQLEQLETWRISLVDGQSKVEDVDLTEAVMNYELEQSAYNIALATGAQIMQLSLLNFLE